MRTAYHFRGFFLAELAIRTKKDRKRLRLKRAAVPSVFKKFRSQIGKVHERERGRHVELKQSARRRHQEYSRYLMFLAPDKIIDFDHLLDWLKTETLLTGFSYVTMQQSSGGKILSIRIEFVNETGAPVIKEN